MTRLVIVDDQELMRTGFRMILDAEADFDIVGEAADGDAARQVCRAAKPDVVLMDIRMPGVDGIEATTRLVAEMPECRVLILTTFDLDEYVFAAVRAGASGFLLKDTPADQLVDAVRVVAAGEALLAPSITRKLIAEFARGPRSQPPTAAVADLTDRETEVLRLLARGMSNAEIANELILGETTVKTHVSRVLMKLGVRDRVQAVISAYENGLVIPGQDDTDGAGPISSVRSP